MRPVSRPRKPLREAPTTSGRPSAAQLVEPAQQLEVVLDRLAEADPGVELDALLGHALGDRERHPVLEERLHVGDDVVVARVVLHRARLAEHVHQAAVRAALRDQGGELRRGAKGGDVVDVGRAGVQGRPGHLELGRVDGDLRAEVARCASITGTTRRSSSSSETGSAYGRVDSPPTSTMSAPSATRSRACSTARVGVEPLPAVRERVRA